MNIWGPLCRSTCNPLWAALWHYWITASKKLWKFSEEVLKEISGGIAEGVQKKTLKVIPGGPPGEIL